MEELRKEILIEDIKETRVYKEIMDTIKKDKIVAYNISFIRKDTKVPVFEFIGGGDIDWENLKTSVNDYNTKEYELWKQNHTNQPFYVILDSLYRFLDSVYKVRFLEKQGVTIPVGLWSGVIYLSNGDWITFQEYFCKEIKRTMVKLDRHNSRLEQSTRNTKQSTEESSKKTKWLILGIILIIVLYLQYFNTNN